MADLEKQNTYTVHWKSIKTMIQKTGELVYLGINQNSFTSSKLWHKSRPISLNRLLTSFSNIKMSIPLLTLLFMSFLLTLWFQGKRSAYYIDYHILYLLCWRYRVFFELLWFFFLGKSRKNNPGITHLSPFQDGFAKRKRRRQLHCNYEPTEPGHLQRSWPWVD